MLLLALVSDNSRTHKGCYSYSQGLLLILARVVMQTRMHTTCEFNVALNLYHTFNEIHNVINVNAYCCMHVQKLTKIKMLKLKIANLPNTKITQPKVLISNKSR